MERSQASRTAQTTLLVCRQQGSLAQAAALPAERDRGEMTAPGVIQQRAFDESRGRIRARPVVVADDPFCCPTAADATSALA